MSSDIKSPPQIVDILNRNLEKAKNQMDDSMEKLSSGLVFTKEDPQPHARSAYDQMTYRLRSLGTAKQNINDGLSFVETADSGLSQIQNMVTRMKEIHTTSLSSSVSDTERRFLFIEYQALYDEINRVAGITEYQGIPLLRGTFGKSGEDNALSFRVGDPHLEDSLAQDGKDLNLITVLDGTEINGTTEYLGLVSAKDLISRSKDPSSPLTIADAQDIFTSSKDDYNNIYDRAFDLLGDQRALFGSLSSRFQIAKDYADIYEENIAAARSKVSDTDYAEETSKMLQAKIQFQSTTALLTHVNNQSQDTMEFLKRVLA